MGRGGGRGSPLHPPTSASVAIMSAPDRHQVTRADGASTALGLSALGIVFGDIGTSPLYTLKTVLALAGDRPAAEVTLGVLSLVFWTLIIIVSIKYVSVAMRADNDGEGGILALMALLGIKRQQRPMIVALGLFGAALIYGDGAITPAISVLSALEGLNIVTPAAAQFVVPASVAILVGLFAIQPLGTAMIGRASVRSWRCGSSRSACLACGASSYIRPFSSLPIRVMACATCFQATRAASWFSAACSCA